MGRQKGQNRVVHSAANAIGYSVTQGYNAAVRDQVISHSEYIGEVYGTSDYSVTKYRLNASDQGTFPWMSQLSVNFEKYKLLSVSFSYRTQTSTTTTGKIMMAFDYDPTDAAPVTMQKMLAFAGSMRSPAWQHAEINYKGSRSKFLTSPIAPTDQAELRQTDPASFYIATAGNDSEGAIGELWVNYSIGLSTPQAAAALPAASLNGPTYLNLSMVNSAVPLLSEQFVVQQSNYAQVKVLESQTILATFTAEWEDPVTADQGTPTANLKLLRNNETIYQEADEFSSSIINTGEFELTASKVEGIWKVEPGDVIQIFTVAAFPVSNLSFYAASISNGVQPPHLAAP